LFRWTELKLTDVSQSCWLIELHSFLVVVAFWPPDWAAIAAATPEIIGNDNSLTASICPARIMPLSWHADARIRPALGIGVRQG
jgi:hypothetical protein